jgi:hypothetical protein
MLDVARSQIKNKNTMMFNGGGGSHHLRQLLLVLFCMCFVCVRGQEASAEEKALEEEILGEVLSATDVVDVVVNVVQEEEKVEEPGVEVEDYLETLGTSELRSICIDRGFGIIPRKDGLPLQRSDYVEAARRCLSLEEEMNAILAKNPELAAELEAEIARMQQHKERLEGERENLLAEKALLEEQLEKAGVDLLAVSREAAAANVSTKKAPEDMTFKEVMIDTFTQLYERVRGDMQFVWKVAGPVLKPVGGALRLAWRYARPHVTAVWEEVLKRAKQIYATARSRIKEKQFQAND